MDFDPRNFTSVPKASAVQASSSEDSYSDIGDDDQEWWDEISGMSEAELMTPVKSRQVPSDTGSPAPKNSRGSDASAQSRHSSRTVQERLVPLKPTSPLSAVQIATIDDAFRIKSSLEDKVESISTYNSRSLPVYTIPDSDSDNGDSTDTDTDDTDDTDYPSTSSREMSHSTIPSTSTSLSFISRTSFAQASATVKGKSPEVSTPKRSEFGKNHSLNRLPLTISTPTPISGHSSSGFKPSTMRIAGPSTASALSPIKANPIIEAQIDDLSASISKLKVSESLKTNPVDAASVIKSFLQLPLGKALDPCIIAHDKFAQQRLDEARVEWGTQWELARGLTRGLWTWDDVLGRVSQLAGSNAEIASRVPQIMGKSIANSTATDVWKELDREEKATRTDAERRLGMMGEWEGEPNWHGGQLQQIARLVKPENSKEYRVALEPIEKRRSHRFARILGSRRILQLRISDTLAMNERDSVVAFLSKKFVLMGRVFVPFHSKDGSVYMVETNEDFERNPQDWCADKQRMSFVDFMEWHNPLMYNCRQAISKYVTRFALGLSNSVPALEFDPDSIFFIDDIYSSDWPVGKPGAPAEKTMTDGCGFINLAGLKAITKQIGYEHLPTAIQGRIDGAKGLWIRHPSDESNKPRIWIRASQNKIKNLCLDRGHRIFELLAPSKPYIGSALSQQSVLNLHHNGVSAQVLIELFKEGLREEVMPLLDWSNMLLLYNAVSKAGGVMGARMARIATTAGRALGLQRAEWRHEDVDSMEDDDREEEQDFGPATYTGRNPYSGVPHQLYEKIIEQIQAGFNPRESRILQEDLNRAMEVTVNTAIEKYRIPLKESLAAFVIPDAHAVAPMRHTVGAAILDPLGVLEEGQIYFRSSQPLKDPKTEMLFDVITGPVVVGRYPIRLPSDLQKVTAVDIPELSGWTDVVIISVKGERSLASMLSGGDMDGDVLQIYREAQIVDNFKSKPLTLPPDDLMKDFEQQVESVANFCRRLLELTPEKAAKEYQNVLLGNLHSTSKGLYSMFHDNAVSRFGYGHPETVRLAYIFNILVDASKSGHRLGPGVFEKDKQEYGKKPLPFGVLAELKEAGKELLREFLKQFEASASQKSVIDKGIDHQLLEPYETLAAFLIDLTNEKSPLKNFLDKELTLIRRLVEAAQELFNTAAGERSRKEAESQSQTPSTGRSKPRAKTSKADQDDIMLAAAKKFNEPLPGVILLRHCVDEIKASYAYKLSIQWKPTGHFAWSVAFTSLCLIKAKAKSKQGEGPRFAPVLHQFDECKNMAPAAVRAYSKVPEKEIF